MNMNYSYTKQDIMSWIHDEHMRKMEESHVQFHKNISNIFIIMVGGWIIKNVFLGFNQLLQYIDIRTQINFCNILFYIFQFYLIFYVFPIHILIALK
jgi:hypothetical protein